MGPLGRVRTSFTIRMWCSISNGSQPKRRAILLITYSNLVYSKSDQIGRPRRALCSPLRSRSLAARRFRWHGQRPDLRWHSSLAAAERGPVLDISHSRGELAQLTPHCDVAEAGMLCGHVAAQHLTFMAPNL